MKKTRNFIAPSLWNNLRAAFSDLGYGPRAVSSNAEPQFKRIQYSEKYNLVVIEIERKRFNNLPENFFETKEVLDVFRDHFTGQKMDFIDLGPLLYVYFWVNTTKNYKSSKFENFAFV